MNMQTLALGFLAATTVGGIVWVFVYPSLSGERQAEKRRASIAKAEPVAARQSDRALRSRREQVEGTLKEVEARQKQAKKVALQQRLTQAGLDWTKEKFLIMSGLLGAAGFVTPLLLGAGLISSVGLGFALGLGGALASEAGGGTCSAPRVPGLAPCGSCLPAYRQGALGGEGSAGRDGATSPKL